MSQYPPLYILRHGETEWNSTGRLQGRFDSPLTPQGQAQACDQRAVLAGCDLTGFVAVSSPQGRALSTARLALDGLIDPVQTDERLSEIDLGDWAGKNREQLVLQTAAVDGFDLYDLAPGGEGLAALMARAGEFLASLPGPAVLITHGMTSRILRLILTGQGLDRLREIGGGQGVVFHLNDGKQKRLQKRG